MISLFDHAPRAIEVAPGAFHLPGWLDVGEQRRLATAFAAWAQAPVPMRAATLPTGRRMSVETVCLGWHWYPYRYSRTADDVNGAVVASLPEWLAELGRHALADAGWHPDQVRRYQPDTALINRYSSGARMGMHQDNDERVDEPVVSLSVGDTARFRFGNPHSRQKPYADVDLRGGDAFVFGGPSRFAYHGVPRTYPGTGDPATGLASGRINVTLRVTGLS
ncbi:MAG: alpha-ketoglutarate-dependent dioxygenase AlkB family protein [Acidimicrobiales bacterium]